jgi:hypothetical protein
VTSGRAIVLAVLLVALVARAGAQDSPGPARSRESLLRETMLGLVPVRPSVPVAQARQRCVDLPAGPADDRLMGPHGGSSISTRCEVVEYRTLSGAAAGRWSSARYRWTSVFTAEDPSRGADARDTVVEEEAVVFAEAPSGEVRPVWHGRFETGSYALWRSVTPELATTSEGTTLLSVMRCPNGTGGCGQEFLLQHRDGGWGAVRQVWRDQLPPGIASRIRHGVRIDPVTRRGETGLYGEHDATAVRRSGSSSTSSCAAMRSCCAVTRCYRSPGRDRPKP